ncbi:HhH-GPD-type base excision DNA repair protein [Mycolicibacterium arseniciresistens]|uniref:HhH-GPD-type base excision DNA repair protein n=1 Tax=Mycolicibacterium arseniciresistens TaxID=3062257 RepID=A0ABT8UNF7_9MYCO|nr:HhH-GPD-type base excision DNA repair protein [Mycolicibacterium arseniciresistens]MDO3639335.1 HhH-GPD-type base excision DNA repair protein [Mycolicibacterium arseniciresistens]
MTVQLCIAQDPEADELLSACPFALLTGMLLDQQILMEVAFAGPKKIVDRIVAAGNNHVATSQQIPMEVAFAGPKKLADRLGGLDARQVAEYDPEAFAALCAERPAVHRFPGSMAKRIQALAQVIVDQYSGNTAALWTDGDPDGAEVARRLKGLPGFGDQKARIFLALLGKQYGVTPKGWRAAAGDYGKAGSHMSVADVTDAGSLERVRSYKKQAKAAAKAAKA